MGLGIGVRSFRNVAAEAIGDWSEDIREGQEVGCFWLCHYVYADHDDYCQHGMVSALQMNVTRRAALPF